MGEIAVRYGVSDLPQWRLSQAALAADPELTRSPLQLLLNSLEQLAFSKRNRFLVGPLGVLSQ